MPRSNWSVEILDQQQNLSRRSRSLFSDPKLAPIKEALRIFFLSVWTTEHEVEKEAFLFYFRQKRAFWAFSECFWIECNFLPLRSNISNPYIIWKVMTQIFHLDPQTGLAHQFSDFHRIPSFRTFTARLRSCRRWPKFEQKALLYIPQSSTAAIFITHLRCENEHVENTYTLTSTQNCKIEFWAISSPLLL